MTPWLFLPGALGSAGQFGPLLAQLPETWRVFTPNFPGHGGVPADQPFSLDYFQAALLKFMDEHELPLVRIFGYSMGGYIALGLAAEHPDRVEQVVTLGTKLDWSPEVAAGMNRMFDPEKIEAKVPQFASQLAQAHAPGDWKKLCLQTAAFLKDLGNGKGLPEEAFSRMLCPVTIGWGDQDNVVTAEESRRVAACMPQGKFEVLEGAKHPIQQLNAVLLAQYLLAQSP